MTHETLHATMAALDLATVEMATFAPHVGTPFTVAGESAPGLTLDTVHPSKGSVPGRRQAFSLVFSGPLRPMLRQGMHTLDHAALGRLVVFLVPVEPDARGARYEAVFS